MNQCIIEEPLPFFNHVMVSQSNKSMGIVMADEGWTKMLTVIKNIQTKKHEHYKVCKAVLIE